VIDLEAEQVITEAKAITPYGMDIAAMLQDGSDVDFNADRPTKETIVETRVNANWLAYYLD
jgi:hypothetical protein